MNIDDWIKYKHKGIIIFGSGRRGKGTLEYADRAGIAVEAFCDNNPEVWGSHVGGKRVLSLEELDQYSRDWVIMIANKSNALDIYAQLAAMGFRNLLFDYCRPFYIGLNFPLEFDDRLAGYGSQGSSKDILVIIDDTNCAKWQIARCEASVQQSMGKLQAVSVRLSEIREDQGADAVIIISAGSVFEGDSLVKLYETWQRNPEKIVISKILSKELCILSSGYSIDREGSLRCEDVGERCEVPEVNYVKQRDMAIPDGIIMSRSWWRALQKDLHRCKGGCQNALVHLAECNEQLDFVYQPQSVVVSENIYKPQLTCAYTHKGHNKGIVLVIDRSVAQFDTNAGHRATKEYIDILQEINTNIIYVPQDCKYDKNYTPYFQQRGVMVVYGCEWDCLFEEKLKAYIQDVFYAFINRPEVAECYIDILKQLNPNIFISYFGHDLHFLRLMREAEVTGEKEYLSEAECLKKKELALLEKVDVAGYPSKVEVEMLRQYNQQANVEYFPLYFFEKKEITNRSQQSKGLLFVGSFGHRPNVDCVKWLITDIMPRVWVSHRDIVVYIVGANPPEDLQAYETENIKFCGFVEDDILQGYYEQCRMAVAPLRYGAGMKGKVLEAMYYGTPLITTSIGAEGIDDHAGILIADSAAGFADCIIKNYNNIEYLNDLSCLEQNYILQNFSKKQIKDMLKKQIAKAIQNNWRC